MNKISEKWIYNNVLQTKMWSSSKVTQHSKHKKKTGDNEKV